MGRYIIKDERTRNLHSDEANKKRKATNAKKIGYSSIKFGKDADRTAVIAKLLKSGKTIEINGIGVISAEKAKNNLKKLPNGKKLPREIIKVNFKRSQKLKETLNK